jgi:hypothetical protein
VETYNKLIAPNDKIELLLVSHDTDEDRSETWAAKLHFPWPIVPSDKIKRAGLEKYDPKGIPKYKLIDKNGKILATGHDAVFAKINEL